SRGGVVSAGLGVIVLLALVQRRQRERDYRTVVAILFGAVLMAAALYAFGGILLGNLEVRGVSDQSRLAVSLLMLRSIVAAPLLGHGYGTFVDVFPLYRDRSIGVFGVWGQAHDTYLELFQGLGVLFALLLIACVALLAVRCARGARRRQQQ